MARARRALEREKRKLNLTKVFIVILLLVIIIISIYFILKNSEEDNNKKLGNNQISNNNQENQIENEHGTENNSETIEQMVSDFGGTITEQVRNDTYYINKDGKEYTAYTDGEIVEGKILPWGGGLKEPTTDKSGNIDVYTADELKWIADQVISGEKNFAGVTITLKNNIDLGSRKNNQGAWEGTNWTSIIGFLDELPEKTENQNTTNSNTANEEGIAQENLKRFAGTFDGNGFWIRGMNIDTDKRYQGLFGYQTGTIKNLTIKNSNVRGGEGTAAIVGFNGGTISNCNIDNVVVSGTEKVGGIAGITSPSSKIENCMVKDEDCNVKGQNYVAGIVGYANNNTTIINSKNNGKIEGNNYIAGICGIIFYGSTISDCSNESSILGKEYVAGISGYSQAQIERSFNSSKSKISGENYVGGIAGLNYIMGNIIESYNNADISIVKDNGGGIVGLNNATISSCYNTGNILNDNKNEEIKIGGICGQNLSDSFIYSSYNIGKVSAQGYIGGIVGANFGELTNSYYKNETLDFIIEDDQTSKTDEEIKTAIINNLGEDYILDTNNINNGYPILSWQNSNKETK